jgi:hypothetical protein
VISVAKIKIILSKSETETETETKTKTSNRQISKQAKLTIMTDIPCPGGLTQDGISTTFHGPNSSLSEGKMDSSE